MSESTDPRTRLLKQIASLLRIIVIAMVLAFCFVASGFCITIVLSALLAVLVDPLVGAVEKLGLGRTLAAGFSVLCVVLLMGAMTYALYQRADSFAAQMPVYSDRIQNALRPITSHIQRLRKGAEELNPAEPPQKQVVRVTETPDWPSFFLRGVGSLSSFLVIAGIAPFLAFFMLLRKEQLFKQFRSLFDESIDSARFVAQVKGMVRGYVLGNLIVGMMLSAATVGMFLIIGLDGAVPLGIACGFLNLIPFLGGILASAISLAAALLQFESVEPFIAIGLTIVIFHLVAVNFLIPKLIGPRLLIGPVATTVGMLFWGWLWGFTGFLLAVPLTAFLKLAADSHSSLDRLSRLLGQEPETAPRWLFIGARAFHKVKSCFTPSRGSGPGLNH